MDAARTLSALAATDLEGPSRVEASGVDTASLAKVIALGVSPTDLDPRAQTALDFFVERLRTVLITPALASASRDALLELWHEQFDRALRLMDGVFLTLYEAKRGPSSGLLSKRLAHSDREALHHSAQTISGHFGPRHGQDLRESLTIIELARNALRQHPELPADNVEWINLLHRGVLIWALGAHMSIALAERIPSLPVDDAPRQDLADDVLDFVNDGARMAGFWAACLLGLEIIDAELSPAHHEQLRRTSFIAFLLRATIEVRRVFGSDLRFGIGEFFYPDEPDAWELHFVIESAADAKHADAALDRLCDEWWDAAVAELGLNFFPVLGTLARG